MPDLQAYAMQKLGGKSSFQEISDEDGSGDVDKLLQVAREVKKMCQDLNLKVLCLQPFSEFEGYTDSKKREAKFNKARVWMDVMEAVGTDMLQVGSTDDTESMGDREVIVRDLRELADMAGKRGMRIGYEVRCLSGYSLQHYLCEQRLSCLSADIHSELVLGNLQLDLARCLGDMSSGSASFEISPMNSVYLR